MSEPKRDIEAARLAENYIHKAMDALKADQTEDAKNEAVGLTEENRLNAIHYLLAAAQQLLPQDHPDTNLQAVLEKWIGTQVSFSTIPGGS